MRNNPLRRVPVEHLRTVGALAQDAAQAAPAPDSAAVTEFKALFEKIQNKLKAGARTETDLAFRVGGKVARLIWNPTPLGQCAGERCRTRFSTST